ncbi:heme/hemin ABC transporter substrate-binding protein [Ferrimonas lipolytica]|uniref:ABC transporter substrate-binding protein n=1 Tax=Ferrimonas lipolytica TaxID=2724191 RepID=A0A6H1UDC7_9GAMM|nr:ABC transporter substrate-binding protein [Ferrimonas lipolytica]QIZ76216.1 ABC transporter substrate-binding protein [Ferrimonas lipolytica]
MNRITLKLSATALALSLSLPAMAAERVVSAGAGITELVMALKAQSKLVAVDMSSQVPEDTEIAKLGYHRALSAEGLLSVDPDLVIGSNEMGPEAALSVVRDAKVKVAVLPTSDSPEQLLRNIESLAELLDADPSAGPLLQQQVEEQLQRIASLRAELQREPKVLFLLLRSDRAPKLGGNGTPADRIITLAGGVNGAGFNGYKSASEETLLAMKPDLILVNKPTLDESDAAKQLLENLPLLKFTPAGENGRVINLSTESLLGGLGPTALNATEQLAQRLVEID